MGLASERASEGGVREGGRPDTHICHATKVGTRLTNRRASAFTGLAQMSAWGNELF